MSATSRSPQQLHRGSIVSAFLDASVLVAATLSPTGGSFRLCRESHHGRLLLITNHYARDETQRVLHEKYPAFLKPMQKLLRWAKMHVQGDPSTRLVAKYLPLIHPEDAPILAGAVAAKANFLITLDRKHFLTERLRHAPRPFTITTPAEFLQRHWRR